MVCPCVTSCERLLDVQSCRSIQSSASCRIGIVKCQIVTASCNTCHQLTVLVVRHLNLDDPVKIAVVCHARDLICIKLCDHELICSGCLECDVAECCGLLFIFTVDLDSVRIVRKHYRIVFNRCLGRVIICRQCEGKCIALQPCVIRTSGEVLRYLQVVCTCKCIFSYIISILKCCRCSVCCHCTGKLRIRRCIAVFLSLCHGVLRALRKSGDGHGSTMLQCDRAAVCNCLGRICSFDHVVPCQLIAGCVRQVDREGKFLICIDLCTLIRCKHDRLADRQISGLHFTRYRVGRILVVFAYVDGRCVVDSVNGYCILVHLNCKCHAS